VIGLSQSRALAPSFGAAAVHSAIIAPYLHIYGTEQQKHDWLPKMASGDVIAAIAMTEPGTGSDLQSVRTTALRRGDEYVINGAKTFITNGYLADLIVLVAKTDVTQNANGISLFLVEADRPGFARGRQLDKVGQHGMDTCELFFDDVRIPADNLLGTEGQGFLQLMQQLPQERLVLAANAVGQIHKAVELTVAYAKQRHAFGKPLIAFQNTRFVLAECATIATIAQAYLDECIVAHLHGELDVIGAAKAKWWLTEQQCIVLDRCAQIFGGYGYMTEYPIARMWADARIQKVYGGTNEIMKEIIGRSL
jgi:alkylation response protein AidB-like acyl-CoA dehydrogenase